MPTIGPQNQQPTVPAHMIGQAAQAGGGNVPVAPPPQPFINTRMPGMQYPQQRPQRPPAGALALHGGAQVLDALGDVKQQNKEQAQRDRVERENKLADAYGRTMASYNEMIEGADSAYKYDMEFMLPQWVQQKVEEVQYENPEATFKEVWEMVQPEVAEMTARYRYPNSNELVDSYMEHSQVLGAAPEGKTDIDDPYRRGLALLEGKGIDPEEVAEAVVTGDISSLSPSEARVHQKISAMKNITALAMRKEMHEGQVQIAKAAIEQVVNESAYLEHEKKNIRQGMAASLFGINISDDAEFEDRIRTDGEASVSYHRFAAPALESIKELVEYRGGDLETMLDMDPSTTPLESTKEWFRGTEFDILQSLFKHMPMDENDPASTARYAYYSMENPKLQGEPVTDYAIGTGMLMAASVLTNHADTMALTISDPQQRRMFNRVVARMATKLERVGPRMMEDLNVKEAVGRSLKKAQELKTSGILPGRGEESLLALTKEMKGAYGTVQERVATVEDIMGIGTDITDPKFVIPSEQSILEDLGIMKAEFNKGLTGANAKKMGLLKEDGSFPAMKFSTRAELKRNDDSLSSTVARKMTGPIAGGMALTQGVGALKNQGLAEAFTLMQQMGMMPKSAGGGLPAPPAPGETPETNLADTMLERPPEDEMGPPAPPSIWDLVDENSFRGGS